MKATVIAIHSGSEYTDGQERITIRVEGADAIWSTLQIPNVDGLKLNQRIELTLAPIQEASVARVN